MAGSAHGLELEAGDLDDIALGDELVGVRRALRDIETEAGRGAAPTVAEEIEVGLVEEELRARCGVDAVDAHDVVDVGVGVGDELDGDAHVAREGEDFVGLVAGVYADSFAGAAVADDPAVFLEHPYDDAADHGLVRNFHALSLQDEQRCDRSPEFVRVGGRR